MQGSTELMELGAGAGAATVGAAFAELARRQGLLGYAPEPRWLAKVWKVPWRVLYEFAFITRALVPALLRRRRRRSVWVAVPFPAGGADAVSTGRRAVATLIENISPNSLLADVDSSRDVALRHDLDPRGGAPTVPA
jgi:hypothetical protein